MNEEKRKQRLREELEKHLLGLGYTKNCRGYYLKGTISKSRVRRLYKQHRADRLGANRGFIIDNKELARAAFASGEEIDPARIDPVIIPVEAGTDDAAVFRLATMLWSVPVSQGFGRRMRFLVKDRFNDRLIGIFALTDPVFNLSARDKWIGWDHEARSARLVHVMDAFVVGAVPPYSQLLGGKLVAALMASREVLREHQRRYRRTSSVIAGTVKRARLVAITTTSVFGRSSLYNRLRVPNGPTFYSIGYTGGYGHFHLDGPIFESLRAYLHEAEHPYATGNRFGMGPNWKLRLVRAALDSIGLHSDSILRHGLGREVFIAPLATNAKKYLNGDHERIRGQPLDAAAISSYCLKRWILPRAQRDDRYRGIQRDATLRSLLKR